MQEHSDVKGSVRDSASVQAETSVNAVQASKRRMREPTQFFDGEGRRREGKSLLTEEGEARAIDFAVPPG